jgi:hypothetical protein
VRHRVATLLSALLLLSLFAAPIAHADTRVHQKAKIQLWVPDHWDVEDGDDDMLLLSEPGGEAAVVFLVLKAKDLETALGAIDKEISKFVTDVQVQGEPEEMDVNGMPAVVIDAKGKVEGKKVDLGLMVVKTPAGKALLVLAMCESSKMKKHEAVFLKVMKSLKPAK